MPASILITKLYIPPLQPKTVLRPHLIKRLNDCTQNKLTLVSASAGFGKTTLISEWTTDCEQPVAWLSLDEEHKDHIRFLTYFIAALQTIVADIGDGLLTMLQSPQPPSTNYILTNLLNEITTIPDAFVLILDDYHLTDSKEIDDTVTYLLEHMPPQMHLVIATREDPHLPLIRLRGRGQLIELRAADLRFTPSESSEYLNQMMDLDLSMEDVTSLETRTEGWITGLQLAAISIHGQKNISGFIESFTGSHHFVLDYLIEEVLKQQSESIQSFLFCTSILDRMCGSLCDAVLQKVPGSGQETLRYLEQSNMFIIPLDNERRWYRYHHLFSELLKQRLQQKTLLFFEDKGSAELHIRASEWYENNDLNLEAFQQAALANDIDRALRLVEGKEMPLYYRGSVGSVLNWLKLLPKSVMDNKPLLWITYASVSLGFGQISGVEQYLEAAEAVLEGANQDNITRDMTGRIASMRAILGVTNYDTETIKTQSLRALEYLNPENLSSRATSLWTLGHAYVHLKDHTAAKKAFNETVLIGKTSGNFLFTVLAKANLGNLLEFENHLHSAAETYRKILQVVGDQPLPVLCEVHLGLARIFYQWNDMDSALQHANSSIELARLFENTIDRFIVCEIFLSHLKLVTGDIVEAASLLAEIAHSVHQYEFVHRTPEVAAQQVLTMIRQGNLEAAAQLAEKHDLPMSKAQVFLARGDTFSALKTLKVLQPEACTLNWNNEQLKVMILKAIALFNHNEKNEAVLLMETVLTLTKPEGFIRIFVDQGMPMFRLLSETSYKGIMPEYISCLIAAFKADKIQNVEIQTLIDPLSQREIEVLKLIALGLSNNEIGEKLFLALDTVKGHNRRIFSKLDVKNRTMAITKARSLNIF
jgi:ATP/maltotriose-dependent transcriptional regulator MalT